MKKMPEEGGEGLDLGSGLGQVEGREADQDSPMERIRAKLLHPRPPKPQGKTHHQEGEEEIHSSGNAQREKQEKRNGEVQELAHALASHRIRSGIARVTMAGKSPRDERRFGDS